MATGRMAAEMVMEPSFMQSKFVLNGIHGPGNCVLNGIHGPSNCVLNGIHGPSNFINLSLVVRTTVESGETTRNMGEGIWCCRAGVLCTVCSRKTSW